jgi:WhiB family redox-sensing transcriptional regulator
VDWAVLANCRGRSDVDFFPESKAGRHAGDRAKDLCAVCFVRAQCLDEALQRDEPGIWGGTTEKERRRIKDKYVRVKGPKPLYRTIHSL